MTEKEYNECVDKYADHLYRFIFKSLKHSEDTRDVVQTAFEKLWRHRETVDPTRSKSFLFTIAYNQMIDQIRKNKKGLYSNPIDDKVNIGVKQNIDKEAKRTIFEALEKLNHVQKSLVMLKDYEGYNYKEIGEIMDLNESQVKVYLHRARKFLRDYLISPSNVYHND